MAKIDELKERMALLKFWLGILVAVFMALVGWLATNYKNTDLLLIIGASVCVVSSCFGVFIVNRRIRALLDEIRKA